jgi:hypothetical protein
LLKKSEIHPNPSFRRKPDKIAGSEEWRRDAPFTELRMQFGQPQAGPHRVESRDGLHKSRKHKKHRISALRAFIRATDFV